MLYSEYPHVVDCRDSRAIYVTAAGQRIVVVRVFIKKTQETPNREIELALKRAKEVLG
jgi:phage-related protein